MRRRRARRTGIRTSRVYGKSTFNRSRQRQGDGGQLALTPSTPPTDPKAPPRATFFDIGANIPGGAPYQPWAKELRAKRMAANNKDNPDAHCLPMGLMQLHGHPQP